MDSYSQYILNSINNLRSTRKVDYTPGSKVAKIQCPNPKHKGGNEDKPSLIINLEQQGRFRAGSAKCFSCGFNLRSWSDVAKAINRPDLISDSLAEQVNETIQSFFQEGTTVLDEDEIELDDLQGSIPWNKNEDWRGIKGSLLKDIDAKLFFNSDIETMMIYLPCVVFKEHLGGIKANLKKQGKRNYFNTKGGWVKSKGLFPYDYTANLIKNNKLKTVCLVEGPRDALNWLQNGIPALAILGSNNWSGIKSDLVLSLPDVETVITAFDPDEAGDKAKSSVYSYLKDEITVKNFNFRKWEDKLDIEGLDPGNSPIKVIEAIKKHIY